MKFKVNRELLSKHLKTITGVLDRNPINAIFSTIKLELDDDLTLIGSNNETSVKISLDVVEVMETGSIAVDGKTFNDAISKMYGDIEIEVVNNLMEIRCRRAVHKIHTTDASHYPNIVFGVGDEVKVNGNDFVGALERVINSVALSATRPILTGVNLKSNHDIIELTATDSYRLSKTTLKLEEPFEIDVTISHIALREIMKLASDKIIFLSLYSSQIMVRVEDENIIFATRAIDGAYPDTNRLIPTDFVTKITLDKLEFTNSINRSSFIKEDNVWVIKLTTQDSVLVLETNAQGVGSTYDEIVTVKEGDDIIIGLNGNYLLDALKAMEDFSVTINFAGDLKPLTISDNSDQVQLLLPVRMHD